jgi:hypothetical protein
MRDLFEPSGPTAAAAHEAPESAKASLRLVAQYPHLRGAFRGRRG